MRGAERIPLAYHRLYREITVTADTLIDILISISAHPLADLYRSLVRHTVAFCSHKYVTL